MFLRETQIMLSRFFNFLFLFVSFLTFSFFFLFPFPNPAHFCSSITFVVSFPFSYTCRKKRKNKSSSGERDAPNSSGSLPPLRPRSSSSSLFFRRERKGRKKKAPFPTIILSNPPLLVLDHPRRLPDRLLPLLVHQPLKRGPGRELLAVSLSATD